jgi:hypothetical protein
VIPIPVVTLIGLLKADVVIASQVGTRVFGEELPKTEVSQMPRKAITLHSNGGRYTPDDLPVSIYRFNTHTYGATVYEAMQLDMLVYEFLKNLERQTIPGGAAILSVVGETGPFTLRDPDTTWPYTLTTYRALVGETVNA